MRATTLVVVLGGAAFVLGGAGAAQAVVLVYTASLDGVSSSPPNASPGTGESTVTIDSAAMTMRVEIEFRDLIGTTTASHIHAPTMVPLTGTAGVVTTTPTFAGFPSGVTSGSFDMTLDLTASSSFNPAFVTSSGGTVGEARDALLAAFEQGRAYLNIHTTFAPGGEIRGFYVPAPANAGLLGIGGLLAARRRRG